jgi:putative hydrolase of the HAD superfamily
MSSAIAIGFDADDTLWHNENIFVNVHARFCELLGHHHDSAEVERVLFATEMRNLELYGYGVKSFTLSAIETAIELTEGRIGTDEIRELIQQGRDMLAHPVELLDGVPETLADLADEHPLILITKGDLRDQQRKLTKSGLADRFRHVEIVAEKDTDTYAKILRRHAVDPRRFFMVGNSLKSDILPVLALGGGGAHVPYPLTWQHERVDTAPVADGRFFPLASLRDVPAAVRGWAAAV